MLEIFAKLGINGKLLIFQIANFLILLFILRKFLYKPIINLLEGRKKKIEKSIEKSRKITEEWDCIQEIKQEETMKAEKHAAEIIDEAKINAQEKEKEILELALEKRERMMDEAKRDISLEKESALKGVKQEASNLILLATEKVLEKNLKSADEMKLIEETLKSLEQEM